MFAEGCYIIYRNLGVCKVEKVGHPTEGTFSQEMDYYTLKPWHGEGIIYVPVNSKVRMRPVMSRKEADNLIRQIPSISAEVCQSRDRKVLQGFGNASLQSQSSEELLRLIKSITIKERMLAQKGKRLGSIDANSRRQAQELLYQELAFVFEIPYETVSRKVAEQLDSCMPEKS
ncbi:MAG: CarD family transcriptional regulator [Candidatus Merdivicinus sp.]